jgi:hypothetical protein
MHDMKSSKSIKGNVKCSYFAKYFFLQIMQNPTTVLKNLAFKGKASIYIHGNECTGR